MAFATSSADFGIKSSAPAQAQAFSEKQTQPSLFGGASQSAFGQSTAQPNTSNSLFGQPPQQSTNSGMNQFGSWGNNNTNNAATNAGTTSWGQSAAQNQSQQAPALGGSVFGNPPQQQQSSIFGGGNGAFGNTNTQQTQNQGNGLLGSNNTQNQTQQPTGSSVFGNSAFGATMQQQQQPSANATSLFGPKPAFGSSFGSTNTLAQPTTNSLWGNPPTLNSGQSAFNQSMAGSSIQAQQQSVPSFTRTTRFNDLPESIQKIFETIDTHIQGRIQISHALKSRSLADEPTKAAETLRRAHNGLVNTVSSQQSDRSVVEEIRSKVDQCVQDTIFTTRIIDGFKNPQQNGTYLKNPATFPLEYFTRAAENIRHKLLWYRSTIEQIERRLVSAQNQAQYTPQVISTTLKAQNKSFLSLAAKTAELDTELQKLKNEYRDLWKAHTGSARDPFNELDRRPGDSEASGASNSTRNHPKAGS